jgi:hypothetical protein
MENDKSVNEPTAKIEEEEQLDPDGYVYNHTLYERLSTPYDSVAVATEKGNDFYKEVCALREKYNVPEFIIAFEINAKSSDIFGRENSLAVIQTGFRGSPPGTNRLILHMLGGSKEIRIESS